MFPRSSFQTVGANPGPRTVSLDLPGLFKHPLRNSRPSTDLLALAEYCPDVRNCRDQIHAAAHRRIFFSGGNRNWSARWKLAATRRPDRSAIHSLSFSRCPPAIRGKTRLEQRWKGNLLLFNVG